jgi:hypothetical protein
LDGFAVTLRKKTALYSAYKDRAFAIMTPQNWQRRSPVMFAADLPKRADIVVSGAGVMGASVAFQLTRAGAGKVLLIDARLPV